MTHNTLTLTNREVLDTAQEGLTEHLDLKAAGYHCSSADLYRVLIGAAVQRTIIEAACAEWVDAPVGNTERGYLEEQGCVEDLPELETCLNRALASDSPRRLWRKPRGLSMDMDDRPYYGKMSQKEGF